MGKENKRIVKAAVVGLGGSGWGNHIHQIGLLPDKFKITAVSDTDKKRMEDGVDKLNCHGYSDFNELLNDKNVELVVIALTSHLHASYSIRALEAGKDVVCEKPMATSLSDADKMIEVSKKTGNILAVFQNARYLADFVKVKEVINSGKLGEIRMIRMVCMDI